MADNIQELKFQVGEAWKGVYGPTTPYGLANVVQDPTGLSIYRSLKSGNVGHPVTDGAWWFRIIDMSSIKAESDRIAALNQAIAQDEALRVAAEELRQQHETARISAENQRNEAEQARIAAEQQRVTKESQREVKEQQRITAEQGRVSAESARVTAEQARVLAETLRANAEDARAAAEINRNADEQQRIANEQARETQYAADHSRAEADHEIAVRDNAQMTELVERADADHLRAASDHTRAESDHATAASDHTQAEQDHTQAEQDHTQAGQDHTRAEEDHTLAAADHQQAVQDHETLAPTVAEHTQQIAKNTADIADIKEELQAPYENITATATPNKGTLATDATITIYDESDVVIAQGTGTVSLRLKYGTVYKVGGTRVYDYLTPAIQTFTAGQLSRNIAVPYTYIERDVITLDQTITDPASMLSGDIQGDVIKAIRANSHLYLGTPATQDGDTEGTELICQLDDEDSTKYADGSAAALDGSEGDQWLKLPVFWWKITAIGEADELGAHDQYSFAYAIADEPDPTWNKWEGDKNLLGAKEMTVIDGVGHSISGGESTGSFTRGAGNTYAGANNLGCQEVTWEWQWMMCMLFYAWYDNTNSQAVCGIGSDSYTRTLGVTDALGMTDTTPAQATSLTSARFWGLEAWWNCKTEWMGNVTSSDLTLTIKDMNTKQNRTVAGFVNCNGTAGYITRMKITDKGDFIPVTVGGTDSTSYCDATNSRTGSRVLFRSFSSANPYGGVACVFANSATSSSIAGIGSRLAFNGVVTEAESVTAYKAAIAAAVGE